MINLVKINLEYNNSDIEFYAATSLILKKIDNKINILNSIKFCKNINLHSIIINYKINILKLYDLNICKINFPDLFEINHEINILTILRKRIEIYQQNLEYIMSFLFFQKLYFQNFPEDISEKIEDCNNILDIIFEEKDSTKYSDILKNIRKVHLF